MTPELILGPPGTGKTYTLIEHVRDYLRDGGHPSRLCMVSFTTKAVREIMDRLCVEFNLTPKDFPYVKTLHAMGYAGLGLTTKDIMASADYKTIGKDLGLEFTGTLATHTDDGIPMTAVKGRGADYLRLVARSRLRKTSLAKEYREAQNYNLYYAKLQQLEETLQNYKSTHQKYDFEDMIEQYVGLFGIEAPYTDLFIVDEGQDLLPLQWDMVKKIAENSERVIVAGDDDQAIHRWAGVDVSLFMQCSSNVRVLDQSYRLPSEIWNLANRISKRIHNRMQKDFYPVSEGGKVTTVSNLYQVPLHEGSWTIMARTNKFAKDFAYELEQLGYFYSIKGNPSIPLDMARAVHVWRELRNGEAVEVSRIKEFYSVVPKQGQNAVVKRGAGTLLDNTDPQGELTLDELIKDFGMLASTNRDEYEVVRIGSDMEQYIRSIERRGENITEPPKIKVSTFHAMKGGEDDNCVVYTGSTYMCVEENDPDDEHRAFYVGITRARKNLYLLESAKKYRYII